MCKLYVVSGPLSDNQAQKILLATNRLFRDEGDGFGFAAWGEHGPVARGRYLNPSAFPGYMTNFPAWLTGPSSEENALPKKLTGLMAHGRTSTNISGLENCHPFYLQGRYLAHNGVLSWCGSNPAPAAKCDSEQLLQWLCNGGAMETAFENFAGYGAVADYCQKSQKLTVACDGVASLFIARRANRQGWAMATTEKHLRSISRAGSLSLDTPCVRMPKQIVEFYGDKIVSNREWRGFGQREWTPLDTTSMGRLWIRKDEKHLFPDYEPKEI